jgi:glutathione synthase/RimK-type ligase-like ATP-grasp enzyme
MKHCALLTCESLEGYSVDEKPLEKALTQKNWSFDWIPWRKQGINWNDYEAVIIRTTWDYTKDPQAFLKQLHEIDQSQAKLLNPFNLVKWNLHKKYLKDLQEKGLPIVATQWVDNVVLEELLESIEFETPFVIKPQVGAGSSDTLAIKTKDKSQWKENFKVFKGRDVMIQPFMESIQSEGEYSAHYFNNQFSHMILKRPRQGDFRSQEEFGSSIKKVEIGEEAQQFCEKILESLPEIPFYSRVDFVKDGDGQPRLMELELIEPSLYFQFDESSAPFFVRELESLMGY